MMIDGRGNKSSTSVRPPSSSPPATGQGSKKSYVSVFRTPLGEAYADIDIADHRETHLIESPEFRRALVGRLKRDRVSLSASDLRRAIESYSVLASECSTPVVRVHQRVAHKDNALYVDLGDPYWSHVKINSQGWSFDTAASVRFRRSKGMNELPRPERGGSISDLRGLLNVSCDDDFILIVSWMLYAFSGVRDFPILVLSGCEGAAKSSIVEMIRELLDPWDDPIRTAPSSSLKFDKAAVGRRLLIFDNVSTLSPSLQDTLCLYSTGVGSHPMILVASGELSLRGDLVDRCVFVNCNGIPDRQRRTTEAIRADFIEAKSKVLGALFDALSRALQKSTTVPESLPRMADFALLGIRAEGAVTAAGRFLKSYLANRAEAAEAVLDTNPIASSILNLLEREPRWSGSATKLFLALTPFLLRTKSAIQSPRVMSRHLRTSCALLLKFHVRVEFTRHGHGGERLIVLGKDEDQQGAHCPMPPGDVAGLSLHEASPAARSSSTAVDVQVSELVDVRDGIKDVDGADDADDKSRNLRSDKRYAESADIVVGERRISVVRRRRKIPQGNFASHAPEMKPQILEK